MLSKMPVTEYAAQRAEGMMEVTHRIPEASRSNDELRQVNQELRRANEELKQIDRLKSEFLSNVSHELRSPLTAIIGFTELMMETHGSCGDPIIADCLQIVYTNSQRLLSLVNELLDITRIESGRFAIVCAPLALQPLLQQLIHEAHWAAERSRLELTLEAPEDLPTVMADGPRLAQVFNNLLANALKFTPTGGSVTVKGYAVRIRGGKGKLMSRISRALLPALPDGRWVVVAVEDTGVGIAEAEIPRLFARFYRATNAQDMHIPGTGLGLYVAKTIIEAQGGYIGVQSSLGSGSKFWFALPASEEFVL